MVYQKNWLRNQAARTRLFLLKAGIFYAFFGMGPLPAVHADDLISVGLEAQGVDAHAALAHPDLDVRDALNRPISRAKIGRQIRANSMFEARHAAAVSPVLTWVFRWLDSLPASTVFRIPPATLVAAVLVSLSPTRGTKSPVRAGTIFMGFFCALVTAISALRQNAIPPPVRLQILRC